MLLIVGLGNIGKEYERTYHNMGFLVLDKLASELNIQFSKAKCNASVGEGMVDGTKVVLAKPTTYMNESGRSLFDLKKKYNAELSGILVVYDDIDLPVGSVRFRTSGSAGTHNGMRSCVDWLKTTELPRYRVGVGKPENGGELANYVLSKIPPEKMLELNKAIAEVALDIKEKIMKRLFC